jgi:hypothetical protein
MITWQLTTTNMGQALAVAFPDGQVVTVPGTHPTFDPLTRHLRGTDDPDPKRVRELLNVGAATAEELRQLSTRVTYAGGLIHFDGQPLDNALTRHLVRLIRAGDRSYGRFVAFLENLAENPSGRSRRQLFTWLSERDMTITPDGQFIAYKGVRDDLGNTSIHSGTASVDGHEHHGHIPNLVGSVITMPRNQVSDDKHDGCTSGLHVGTWEYAHVFGRRTLIVSVNPRDVVSVPKDCEFQKLRCCRYAVLDVIRSPLDATGYDAA